MTLEEWVTSLSAKLKALVKAMQAAKPELAGQSCNPEPNFDAGFFIIRKPDFAAKDKDRMMVTSWEFLEDVQEVLAVTVDDPEQMDKLVGQIRTLLSFWEGFDPEGWMAGLGEVSKVLERYGPGSAIRRELEINEEEMTRVSDALERVQKN